MQGRGKSVQLIIADDDEDDYFLTRSVLQKNGLGNEFVWVKNGEELLDFLKGRGSQAASAARGGARLVLLDLNMPRMDGREAIMRLMSDPELRGIPVIVMTTSDAEEEALRARGPGARAFIHKPVAFPDFVKAANLLGRYRLEMVELADAGGAPWTRT